MDGSGVAYCLSRLPRSSKSARRLAVARAGSGRRHHLRAVWRDDGRYHCLAALTRARSRPSDASAIWQHGASDVVSVTRNEKGWVLHLQNPARTNLRDFQTYLGMTTVSMTWITPLSATMSVLVTWALSTITLPSLTATVSDSPCTVLTLPDLTSAAITLPGTTW